MSRQIYEIIICTSKLIYINVLRLWKHVDIYFDINLMQLEFLNNTSITSASDTVSQSICVR